MNTASTPPKAPAASAAKRNVALAGLLGLALGFVGGYGAGRVSTGTTINPLVSNGTGGGYQEGYDAARKKIEAANLFPAAPTQALSLSGTVKAIGPDSLTIEAQLSSPNPLEAPVGPKERTVHVSAATVVERMVQKSPDDFQKESAAFQAQLAAGKTDGTPPSPFSTEKLALSDLKVGDTVVVTADHDILKAADIAATGITLTGSPQTPLSAQTPTTVPAPTPIP